MHTHRIEVLDRADDYDVVAAVAHHFELELVPAEQRVLHEHLPDRALAQGTFEQQLEFRARASRAAAVAAKRERRPQDDRKRELLRRLLDRRDDPRLGHLQAGRADGLAEELTVLGPADHVRPCTEQLHPQRLEDA